MKDSVKVVAMQTALPARQPNGSLTQLRKAIEGKEIKNTSPELLVLPALVNGGPLAGISPPEDALDLAEAIPGSFTEAIATITRQHGIHIVAGMLEKDPRHEKLYNSAILVGPNGELLGVQRQVHAVGKEKGEIGLADNIETFSTVVGRIGMIVGTDFEYPEVARVQALQGAEILCNILNRTPTPSNLLDLVYYLSACRAWENKCFVVSCNRVGSTGNLGFGGMSCIMDTNGQPLANSNGQGEEMLIADLLRDAFYEDRASKPYFRDRRPEHYGPLAQSIPSPK
ncbi:MAG: carbon-nitrogen hydrolase family protein [Chloroflexota bacterium]